MKPKLKPFMFSLKWKHIQCFIYIYIYHWYILYIHTCIDFCGFFYLWKEWIHFSDTHYTILRICLWNKIEISELRPDSAAEYCLLKMFVAPVMGVLQLCMLSSVTRAITCTWCSGRPTQSKGTLFVISTYSLIRFSEGSVMGPPLQKWFMLLLVLLNSFL